MILVNVCACFDVMISHGWPAKLPRRCSFFLSVLSFLFSFSFFFLQCFWPCPFFFLQGPMLSWKSYNLNRFAKPTRCHPFNSFLQQPGIIICMAVILFATRGSTLLNKCLIMMKKLRGAWRDHRFPEPFSWFLHETGLESLKITTARCFLLKCQRKVSKKAKEHRWFRGVLGALAYSRDRPYNFSCLSAVSKNRRFRSFFSALGCHLRGKAFRDQQCHFLTRNKSLSSENESNYSMTSECVRTDSILPRGAGLEHGRYKQSIFSLSIFGILVERLSF